MGLIVQEPAGLPIRIHDRFLEAQEVLGNLQGGFKTAYKPNPTVPRIWVVLAERGILLCSTHRSRGTFALLHRTDVDSLVLEKGITGCAWLKISPAQLDRKEYMLPLDPGSDEAAIRLLLSKWRRQEGDS